MLSGLGKHKSSCFAAAMGELHIKDGIRRIYIKAASSDISQEVKAWV